MTIPETVRPAAAADPDDTTHGRLILVLGTNRSGTTWLHRLLLAHRDIGGVESETLLMRSLASLWRSSVMADADTAGSHVAASQLSRHSRRFCDELIDTALKAAENPGARHFAEETPGTALHLPWVKLVFPDAWYIRIVRDGRDVARSMRLRDYGSQSDLFNIRCWARHERMADAYLRGVPRVIDIRYEDLFADPLGQMLRVYDALGLPRYAGLTRDVARRASTPVARYTGEAHVGPGKWRADVSRRRLGIMYASAGETLCRPGYLSGSELSHWKRRPEYWLGAARRCLLRAGLGRRNAVWLFSPRQGLRPAAGSPGAVLGEWAELERAYMLDSRAVRSAVRRAPTRSSRGAGK